MTKSTHYAKAGEVERKWVLIDADGLTLGRLATRAAMILRGKDDFARYHANQGLVLLIAEGVASAALSILGMESLGGLVAAAAVFGKIKGVMNVLRGKKEPLPFIGGINLLK